LRCVVIWVVVINSIAGVGWVAISAGRCIIVEITCEVIARQDIKPDEVWMPREEPSIKDCNYRAGSRADSPGILHIQAGWIGVLDVRAKIPLFAAHIVRVGNCLRAKDNDALQFYALPKQDCALLVEPSLV